MKINSAFYARLLQLVVLLVVLPITVYLANHETSLYANSLPLASWLLH